MAWSSSAAGRNGLDREKLMSDATVKATVKVRLIGKAQSGEAFALRDFLQRSVVAFDWVELGRDERIDRELALSEDEARRLPVVQLPDGGRLYAPSGREPAPHPGLGAPAS